MKQYWMIGMGGFLGALSRVLVKKLAPLHLPLSFPLHTFLVNIFGSFFLALFMTSLFKVMRIREDVSFGISTGFFGAFTTFSTFSKEALFLSKDQGLAASLVYITLSLTFGLFFTFAGVWAGSFLTRKFKSQESEGSDELSGP